MPIDLEAPSPTVEKFPDVSHLIAGDIEIDDYIPLALNVFQEEFPCSSYIIEPAELVALVNDCSFPLTPDERLTEHAGFFETDAVFANKAQRRAGVTFAPSDTHSVHCSEHEVPPYSEHYGIAPRLFDFDADGEMVPAMAAHGPPNFAEVRQFISNWDQ